MFEIPMPVHARSKRLDLADTHLLQARALQGIDSATLALLGRSARFIAAGHRLRNPVEGNAMCSLFLMVDGHAALCARGKVVELPGAGELFGEERILSPDYETSVVLLANAKTLAIPASAILSALDDSPALVRALLANLSRRSLRIMERMEWHAKRSALERVAAFLMEQMPAADRPCVIKLPASKAMIASLLSMSKESLSRCLAQLAAEAGVGGRGSIVHVPTPWRLAQICGARRSCADCGGCRHRARWMARERAA